MIERWWWVSSESNAASDEYQAKGSQVSLPGEWRDSSAWQILMFIGSQPSAGPLRFPLANKVEFAAEQ